MKKVIVLCLLAFVCFTSHEAHGKQNVKKDSPVALNGALSVKGNQLVNSKGEPVVLKGVSYGWHNFWPRFFNSASVSTFARDWNCNVVRAAIGADNKDCYAENPELSFSCAMNVIDGAIENGIYVIVDWHTHAIQTEAAKEFFTVIATKYKDYPNLIYEVYNEPIDDSWEEIKEYAIDVISAIRNIAPHNIVLVGCPRWDQDIHLPAGNPITGFDNIMYTLHFYAATHGKELRERADYAIGKGLPVFVSECGGMDASGNTNLSPKEWAVWVEWMQKHHLSWVAYSISDKDETCSMLYPTASSEGPWLDSQIKEWGHIVKKELLKK